MRYAPEWCDQRCQSWVAPTEAQQKKLERLVENYNGQEVEMICAGFDMDSNGAVPKRVCVAADALLRGASKTEPAVLRALSFPTKTEAAEIKKL